MSRLTRRGFLKTAAAAATVTIAGTKSSGRVLGANDSLRIGVAGIHGRGTNHISELLKQDGVRITYLIDPDKSLFESRSKSIVGKHGQPTCVQDVRKALDDKNLDAITIATPNHWHSLMTIWACQAGKDVYVEKPLSHNVTEGRRCVEAAQKHGRIVQHGTQQRSSLSRANEIAAIQSGRYGKLVVSKGVASKPRPSINTKPTGAPPENVAFDLWLGPAAQQPYHANLVHYNWHWFWDFGNGEIGNQGVHEYDVARWAIKDATLPTKVWSLGGRFGYKDQGQTPNTQMAVMEFGDVILLFEVRGLVKGSHTRNEFYTTEGRFLGGKFYKNGSDKGENLPRIDGVRVTDGGPFGSWVRAIRSRKAEDLNADVEKGHYSSALCHLANISYRLGETAPYDAPTQRLGDNKEVVESFRTMSENLKEFGVKLQETTYTLGKVLNFDPKGERFIGEGAAAANAHLTRDYRAPFVVPAKV